MKKENKEEIKQDHLTQDMPQEEVMAGTADSVEKPEIEVDELQEEENPLEALTKELEELKDAHLRLRAEYDNYRKRTLKEKSDLIKYGGEKIVLGFLDVMDDLELALANIRNSESLEGVLEGVELIRSKFLSTLKAQGINEINSVGEPFDADVHEAIAMVPTEDEEMQGKVIDCIRAGYTLNDKVIRHPKVVVGRKD